MSSFTGELTLTHLDVNWRLWRLESEFSYEVGNKGSGRKITVPAGFVTDGTSIPQALWAFLPTWGTYSRAAIVHDYLCWSINKNHPHPEAPSRAKADKIFLEAMKVCGTSRFVRWVLYAGVRVGSFFPGRNIVNKVNP